MQDSPALARNWGIVTKWDEDRGIKLQACTAKICTEPLTGQMECFYG